MTPLQLARQEEHYAIALVFLTAKAKGFLAKNKTAIVTFLSLVVVGLLAAHFVPQVFLFLTGPLLFLFLTGPLFGSLGLIHNLPVLQVTVLSLISLPLVGPLVNRLYGRVEVAKSDGQDSLRSGEFKSGIGKNPGVLGEFKGPDAQVDGISPANK